MITIENLEKHSKADPLLYYFLNNSSRLRPSYFIPVGCGLNDRPFLQWIVQI